MREGGGCKGADTHIRGTQTHTGRMVLIVLVVVMVRARAVFQGGTQKLLTRRNLVMHN